MVDKGRVPALMFLVFLMVLESTFEQATTPNTSSLLIERAALLELRSSLGIRSTEWPRKAVHCKTWKGVICHNGAVTEINISGFKRTRIGRKNPNFVADALLNLSQLSSFNASGFFLPGSIPDWFGTRLKSLRVLDLSSCSISNSIPWGLGNLSSLTRLYLSDNSLTDVIPSSLGNLMQLSVLDLSRNTLTGSIPSSFASLASLTRLDVSLNFLSGSIPSGIGSLSRLMFLNLSGNSLSSSIPAQLGDLDTLVDLDVSVNSLSGLLPLELRGLKSLQKLLVGDNFLTGPVPGVVWSLPVLQVLDISNNNFTGALPNAGRNFNATASKLNISGNLFYGNVTPAVTRFRSVDLSDNFLQGTVPDYLPKNASLIGNCFPNELKQKNRSNCVSFYADQGLIFDVFRVPNTSESTAEKSSRKSQLKIIIPAAVVGGVGLVAVISCLLVFLFIRIRKQHHPAGEQQGGGVASVPSPSNPVNLSSLGDTFTHQQILLATADFSAENLIKNGHSGALYKGILENGSQVVVKKVDLQVTKKEAYLKELDLFSKVVHPRLVPLLGHCLENENDKFLVYKYMPHGDLGSSLYKKIRSEDGSLQSLDWITRLKIAIEAAEGLSGLHHECTPPIVHRDIQASSILLDAKYEVRLGSLSEMCVQEGDTSQSRISRLLRFSQPSEQATSASATTATCAYDVYCFGKVLLELVTGRMGVSAFNDTQLKEWLEQTLPCISMYDKDLMTKIIDPSLIIDEDLLEEVWAMAIIARSCLNPKPLRRPLMKHILEALENPLKVVREENSNSGTLRATSSKGSWNAALFSSWRQSSADVTVVLPESSASAAEAGCASLRQLGPSNSQRSGWSVAREHSFSHRCHSKEIFPEPFGAQEEEKLD